MAGLDSPVLAPLDVYCYSQSCSICNCTFYKQCTADGSWVDETAGGRWPRGENSNYGLVRLDNSAYSDLTAAMTRANAAAPELHAAAAAAAAET